MMIILIIDVKTLVFKLNGPIHLSVMLRLIESVNDLKLNPAS